MKKLFILASFLLILPTAMLRAQELTLEECQQQAREHYPLIKRYGLIEKQRNIIFPMPIKGICHNCHYQPKPATNQK